MLADCKTLDNYFARYGELLGARATKALAPLHIPGTHPEVPGIDAINDHVKLTRQSVLFGAQRDVLSGMAKALRRQKSLFLAAECGAGKSLMGAAASQVHAAHGRPYRGLVMCPDHLIKKWGREIEKSCPGATWRSFDDWKEVFWAVREQSKPAGPEWWIIGRDQSKGDPAWETKVVKRRVLVGEKESRQALRKKGVTLAELTSAVAACPRCGAIVTDKDNNPRPYAEVVASKKKLTCEGTLATYRQEGDESTEDIEDIEDCGEPLWSFVVARTREDRAERGAKRAAAGMKASTAPYRWPAYRSIKGQMNRQFDFLILDEVHELKGGDDIGQANAAGAFIARSKKVIALTGTMIGGYADHLFPLLMRMAPRSLVEAGFEWDDFAKFNARYGRIETRITTGKDRPASETSNSHSKGGSSRTTRIRRPGIMPQLYGDHLIDKCCFLQLDQLTEGLPSLAETIIPIRMDAEQSESYEALEGWLRATVKMMMQKGDKRLLASMLENLLYWPDHPFGWDRITTEQYGCFQPATLDEQTVRPKEEALVALCLNEAAMGRQVWVYVQRVGTRDVGARLVKLLGTAGLRVAYEPALRAAMMRSSVDPRDREEWIYRKGKDLDVCISHPDLVKTGLDLFAPDGNHNFCTLVFYQSGYNSFTIRQAGRRAWRIGQKQPCKTVFLYYQRTMQEGAMAHMGRKQAACEAIDGKFSAEGLAAMGGDDDATMALAKSLVDRVALPEGAVWSKTLGYEAASRPPAVAPAPAAPAAGARISFTANELDILRRLSALTKRA